MSLSNTQNDLLNQCQVPLKMIHSIGQHLDENGVPKRAEDPDFLSVIGNHLREAEKVLQAKRIRLAKRFGDRDINDLGERTPEESEIEDDIKLGWAQTTALWRAADKVVANPTLYGSSVTLNHIRYALAHKNLPIVEMIRWSHPEYFEVDPPNRVFQGFGKIFGFIGAAILGLFGGFFGGVRLGLEKHPIYGLFWAPLYALRGIFTGSALAAGIGATFGYETGKAYYGAVLGFYASFNNPLNEPAGSRYQQEVELQKQRLLFRLAEQKRK